MRAYVTGSDHLQYTYLAEGSIQVNVTHSNLKQFVMELRLDLSSPISEVKRKLYTHNGSAIEAMELELRDDEGRCLARMLDDSRPLGFYGAQNGMTIHVIDTDPYSLSRDGGLDDVSKIEKYRMTDEDYDKRENTLRSYKKKMLEKDPTFKFVKTGGGGGGEKSSVNYEDEACIAGISVGGRCEVAPGARRGTIMYVGAVGPLPEGYWVGVKLDEPLGKGDGSRGGLKFFDAEDKYGAFVRPDHVVVGDFPPDDYDFGVAVGGGRECEGEHHHHSHDAAATGAGASTTAVAESKAGGEEKKVESAATAKAVRLNGVGGMVRKGGMRADDSEDDDEL